MKVAIFHDIDGTIVFRFGDHPTPVSSLVVADENEDTLWEIESGSESAASDAVPVIEGRFLALRTPAAFADLLGNLPDDSDRYPPVTEITYGELPAGFREIEPAAKLTSGKKYCVTVFGAGLDTGGDFFTP